MFISIFGAVPCLIKVSDSVTTSQGAERQMDAELSDNICYVELQRILVHVVYINRRLFMNLRNKFMSFDRPVPLRVEKHLASIILRSKV